MHGAEEPADAPDAADADASPGISRCAGSVSACLWHGLRRAGTQKDRLGREVSNGAMAEIVMALGERSLTVHGTCPVHAHTHVYTHVYTLLGNRNRRRQETNQDTSMAMAI